MSNLTNRHNQIKLSKQLKNELATWMWRCLTEDRDRLSESKHLQEHPLRALHDPGELKVSILLATIFKGQKNIPAPKHDFWKIPVNEQAEALLQVMIAAKYVQELPLKLIIPDEVNIYSNGIYHVLRMAYESNVDFQKRVLLVTKMVQEQPW